MTGYWALLFSIRASFLTGWTSTLRVVRTPKTPERLPHLARTSRDYHLSLHRIQGKERFHLALDERGRVMDVCRTGQRKAGLIRVGG